MSAVADGAVTGDEHYRNSIWRYCRVTVARMPEGSARART